MKLSDGLFRDECIKAAKAYPGVQVDEIHVDAAASLFVRNPCDFDVVVTSNMYGDILTDSSLSSQTMVPTYQGNAETNAILQEAHDVLEGRVKTAIPEPPSTSLQHTSPKKESMI